MIHESLGDLAHLNMTQYLSVGVWKGYVLLWPSCRMVLMCCTVICRDHRKWREEPEVLAQALDATF